MRGVAIAASCDFEEFGQTLFGCREFYFFKMWTAVFFVVVNVYDWYEAGYVVDEKFVEFRGCKRSGYIYLGCTQRFAWVLSFQ
jgi:hypothetical protein